MAQFIRVRHTLINLDRVQEVTATPTSVSFYFSGDSEDAATFHGDDAAALHAYLTDLAPDVLAIQAARNEAAS
jgi:hypothetical protein